MKTTFKFTVEKENMDESNGIGCTIVDDDTLSIDERYELFKFQIKHLELLLFLDYMKMSDEEFNRLTGESFKTTYNSGISIWNN